MPVDAPELGGAVGPGALGEVAGQPALLAAEHVDREPALGTGQTGQHRIGLQTDAQHLRAVGDPGDRADRRAVAAAVVDGREHGYRPGPPAQGAIMGAPAVAQCPGAHRVIPRPAERVRVGLAAAGTWPTGAGSLAWPTVLGCLGPRASSSRRFPG